MHHFETVLVEKRSEDGIAIVTINRPPMNPLNTKVLDELHEAFTNLGADPDVRCIVLTGAGEKSFVAGADIKEMVNFGPIEAMEFVERGQKLMDLIESIEAPVICAVNGFALGGGTEIALACDFIYASKNAKFGQPEINLGILPGFGGTQRLSRKIGPNAAKEWILTGDILSAEEAYRVRLVNKLVDGNVLDAAIETAKKIAAKGWATVKWAKRLVNLIYNAPLSAGLLSEKEIFAYLCATEDQKEGMKAFIEKRKPNFKLKKG